MKLKTPVILYFGGLVLSRAVSFLLLPVLLNILSKEEFAYYSLLVSVFLFASVIFQAGLPQIVSSLFNKETTLSRDEISGTLFSLSLLIGAVLLIISGVTSGLMSKAIFGTDKYTLVLLVLFIGCYFENLIYFLLQIFKTEGKPGRVFVYTLVQSGLTLGASVWALLYARDKLLGLMTAHGLAAVLVFILVVAKEKFRPNSFKILPVISPTIKSLAGPIIISGIMTTCLDVVDRFILNATVTAEELALYSFAYRLGIVMNLFVFAFRAAWIPYSLDRLATGKGTEGFGRIFNVLVAGMLVTGFIGNFIFPFFTGVEIAGKTIVPVEYSDGFLIMPLILTAYFFNGLASFYSVYSYRQEMGKDFLISDMTGAIINIVGNLLLIPKMGIMGAAVATIFGYFSSSLYLFIRSSALEVKYELKPLLLLLAGAFAGMSLWVLGKDFEAGLIAVLIVLLSSIPVLLPSIRQLITKELISDK